MTTTPPALGASLLELLDALEEPVSVGSAIRGRDGRILDFRLDFVNLAAARWAGIERSALVGLITGELLPELRASGYFDALCDVVETGRPHSQENATVADSVTGGGWVGGMYDLHAIRLGDGYLSTWRLRAAAPDPR